jgi:glutamyl-Q tRNA(Asp) synthetase
MKDSNGQARQYIGRFAPSPTGALHMGSLLTAMASYCEAMSNKGKWLVRIEDLDPPREIPGASHKIITTLQQLGFNIKQKIIYQSDRQRQIAYQQALDMLLSQSQVYYCDCSRNDLKNLAINQHRCRNGENSKTDNSSIKLKVKDQFIAFIDKIQGTYKKHLMSDCGDCVLKRKDQLFSYQLAVVVDDHFQGITDIVRGIDLIESTPWQIYLNSILKYNNINYAHIPILVNDQGQKLSKQTHAAEIDCNDPLTPLLRAYSYLNQQPLTTKITSTDQFWQHAIAHWDISRIARIESITVA